MLLDTSRNPSPERPDGRARLWHQTEPSAQANTRQTSLRKSSATGIRPAFYTEDRPQIYSYQRILRGPFPLQTLPTHERASSSPGQTHPAYRFSLTGPMQQKAGAERYTGCRWVGQGAVLPDSSSRTPDGAGLCWTHGDFGGHDHLCRQRGRRFVGIRPCQC